MTLSSYPRARTDGIELADLDGRTIRCWYFDDLREVLTPGSPVAVHGLYGVLALEDELLNVSLTEA